MCLKKNKGIKIYFFKKNNYQIPNKQNKVLFLLKNLKIGYL